MRQFAASRTVTGLSVIDRNQRRAEPPLTRERGKVLVMPGANSNRHEDGDGAHPPVMIMIQHIIAVLGLSLLVAQSLIPNHTREITKYIMGPISK